METTQLVGPFEKNRRYRVDVDNALFVQVGIEKGVNTSMIYDSLDPDISVNGTELRISDNCVLEWDSFADASLIFVPLKNLDEYTIIDIAYE